MRTGTICLAAVIGAAGVFGGETSFGAARTATKRGDTAKGDASAWPAWRKAMKLPNTVYDISDNTVASLRFIFPGGQIPSQFANSDDGGRGTGAGIIGYGGGVLLRGVGKYGVMTVGSGGHNFAGNYTGALNLNGDAAHYEVWQQPIYSLKPGAGVEFYWSPTDAAALPENRRFVNCKFDAKTWNGRFPIAIGNWVYPGPVKYVEVGDQIPTGQYRYDQHCYIPAQYSGLGTGVWFIPSNIVIAPGFVYGVDMKLCADFWPSGKKKWYSHYQREDTKAWGRASGSPIPERMTPGGFYPGHFGGSAGFCAKHKIVFVPAGSNNEAAVFDLSSGVARGTWSWRRCVVKGRWTGHALGKSAMSNRHPRNRAFYVWYGPRNALNIVDLDDPAYPLYVVPLKDLKASPSLLGERAGLHYVPSLDRFISFGITRETYCQTIKIPDNLADVESYVVEDVALTPAQGVDLASSYTASGLVQYVESLNCIVFMAVRTPAKAFWIQ